MKRHFLLLFLCGLVGCGTVQSTPDDAAIDAAVSNPGIDGPLPIDASIDAAPAPVGAARTEAVEFVGGAGSARGGGGFSIDITVGHGVAPTSASQGPFRVESGAPQNAH